MPPRAVTTLPEGYSPRFSLGPEKSWNTVMGLSFVGLLLISAVWMLFALAASQLRPELRRVLGRHLAVLAGEMGTQLQAGLEYVPLLWMCSAVLAFVLLVAVHESTHALFFWIVTGRRPVFGFAGNHAYVAAPPGVYVSRNAYVAAALAPLVLLTVLGVALIPLVPLSFVWVLAMFVVFNAGGAVSDVRVAASLLLQPPSVLVRDEGDVMTVYGPVPVHGRRSSSPSGSRRSAQPSHRRMRRPTS